MGKTWVEGCQGLGKTYATWKWDGLEARTTVNKGRVLFPRIEAEIKREESKIMDTIDIEEFAKIKLRVAKIISAENIPNSKKLLKLMVDIGDEKRQLVAGIALHYKPEDIIGKSVVIVANLKPAKLMGIETQVSIIIATTLSCERLL